MDIFGKFAFTDSSPLALVIILIIAFFLWGAGFKLYKLAVFFLGFLFGFTASGMAGTLFPSPPVPFVIIQVIAGLAVGFVAFMILKLGLFIGAAFGTFLILSHVLERLGTVGLVIAFAAAVVAGFIATKADKPVIIVLTGLLGGFMIPQIVCRLAGSLPFDTSFMPPQNSMIYLLSGAFLSALGIALQFGSNKDKD